MSSSMPNPHLVQTARATIRQTTGKQYPKVEALLDSMDAEQMQELIRMIRDAEDGGRRKAGANARRMGLGHLVR